MKLFIFIVVIGNLLAEISSVAQAEKKLVRANGTSITVKSEPNNTYRNCAGQLVTVDPKAGDVIKDSTETCPPVRARANTTPYSQFFTTDKPILPNGHVIDASRIRQAHAATHQ